ncbi:hypothetical protein ACQ4LE_003582 [Meloidogyne hapla]
MEEINTNNIETNKISTVFNIILNGKRFFIFDVENEKKMLPLEDENIHNLLWSKFLPYFIFALIIYSILAICWIFWNIYTYRRDLENARKGRTVRRLYERWRLLSIYDQIPLPISNGIITTINNEQENIHLNNHPLLPMKRDENQNF